MSAPMRFLALAVVGWVGLRAATLGMVPGAELFTTADAPAPFSPAADPQQLGLAPPAPGAVADAQPLPPGYAPYGYGPYPSDPYAGHPAFGAYPSYPAYPPQPLPVRPVAVPYYHYVPVMRAAAPLEAPQPRFADLQTTDSAGFAPSAEFYAPIPPLEQWDLAQLGTAPWPRGQAQSPATTGVALPPPRALDRLQLSTWALLRQRPGPQSLASGGMLGGSQAGARMTYTLDRRLALSLRTSSPVGAGTSGGEVAGGVRVTPLPNIPLSLTAERRQAIGRDGSGRSAFALFAEGGLYQRPIAWGFALDGYAQSGIVGLRSRDLFVDGSLALTRPLYGPVSVGLGLWGGAQPGLYRLDAGPRASIRVRHNMRVHLDWRQRLVGNAEPGSGPAVTVAADF